MIYAVMGYATFRNTSQRDGAHTDIQTQLVGRETWGPVILESAVDSHGGGPSLSLVVRVTAEPDMHDLFTQAQAALAQRGWLSGWLHWHHCPHDEAEPTPCAIGGEVTP